MMMFADPFRMMVVPPIPTVPYVKFVIVAIDDAPLGVNRDPFGMMVPDPAGVMCMPPARVVPDVVVVPVTVMVRMCHHRRSREQGGQGSGGKYCSKFHSWYLLEENKGKSSGTRPHSINTMHRRCQFQAIENREKSAICGLSQPRFVWKALQNLQSEVGRAVTCCAGNFGGGDRIRTDAWRFCRPLP